jgi:AmmeMemoRadiSam system protein B
MGHQSASTSRALADALAATLRGRRALLVASTDLSHYHDAASAAALDRVVIDCVARFDPDALQAALDVRPDHACGGGPTVAVMRAARQLGARDAVVLNYADSGDVSGDKSAVVGYLAAAFGNFDKTITTNDTKDTKVKS